MLLSQNRRRNQHGHLLAVVDRHKCRPQCHLCLAVAHVTAYEPIHGHGLSHIVQDLLNDLQLIGGFFERKSIFKILKLSFDRIGGKNPYALFWRHRSSAVPWQF